MKALRFQRPILNPLAYISLLFGQHYRLGIHTGVDIESQQGSCAGWPVGAIAWGTVTYAQQVLVPGFTVWGNLVVIRHELPGGQGLYSRSAHLDDPQVRAGEIVRPDQFIGRVGNGFGVYAYHLHFDLCKTAALEAAPWDWPGDNLQRVLDNYVDPYTFIRSHVLMAGDLTTLQAANANEQLTRAEMDAAVKAFISPQPPEPPTIQVVVKNDGTNVRAAPTTSATVLRKVNAGTVLTVKDAQVYADGLDWYALVGTTGYIAQSVVSPKV